VLSHRLITQLPAIFTTEAGESKSLDLPNIASAAVAMAEKKRAFPFRKKLFWQVDQSQ